VIIYSNLTHCVVIELMHCFHMRLNPFRITCIQQWSAALLQWTKSPFSEMGLHFSFGAKVKLQFQHLNCWLAAVAVHPDQYSFH